VVKPTMQQTGLKNCSESILADAIAQANALNVVREIRQRSPILNELLSNKKVGIVAGIHNIKTGEVRFFDEERSVPE